MPSTVTSTNMAFPIPVVGDDIGPQWAYDINACLNIIDGHDHSPGSGVQIGAAGLNIDGDFTLNSNNIISIRSARFTSQSVALSLPTDLRCLYVVSSDLYYNDGSGNQVRITQGGGVAGSPGSIGSLVAPASATYVGATPAFVFQSAATTPAHLDGGSVILRNISAGSYGLTLQPPTLTANYALTLPSIPAGTSFMTMDNAGVMAASISTSQGITRSMQAAVGQQISSSTGTFSTTSATFVDVTNAEVTITTTGRPVFLMMVSDGGGSISAIYRSGAGGRMDVAFTRNGTVISQSQGEAFPGFGLFHLDPVSAGTYTYKFQVLSTAGATVICYYSKLIAYEL